MKFSLAEIAAATDGRVVAAASTDPEVPTEGAAEVMIDGVSIDSRTVAEGQLFVPIVAERDGHDWIGAAAGNGAAATLVGEPRAAVAVPSVRVADTAAALTALGAAAGRRLGAARVPVVGITGSVGKTSVKDLSAAALRSLTPHANERSFNNELGVPLTLLNAPVDSGVVVVEMGARGIGHVAHLCEIARPTIGVVTMVGAVHTSEFGDVSQVAKAKSELVQAVPATGTAILNVDSPHVAAMAPAAAGSVVTYAGGGPDAAGNGSTADFTAADVTLDDRVCARFVAQTPVGTALVQLAVAGVHQVGNALAALAVAVTVGVDLAEAADNLSTAALSPLRMDIGTAPDGTVVVNDSYNANALSMEAALRSLVALPQPNRTAVLGTMAELGERHDADHAAVAALAQELGVELIAFGEVAYGTEPAMEVSEVVRVLHERGALGDGCAVLVKGSRSVGLERVADALMVGGD